MNFVTAKNGADVGLFAGKIITFADMYDDIIDLPHHQSATRRPMPAEGRAAQFAPFAALGGFAEKIEQARLRQADLYNPRQFYEHEL